MGSAAAQVHRFGFYEQTFTASTEYNNPLKDVEVIATFHGPQRTKEEVLGFWDGDRTWKIRYSPEHPGRYRYEVRSGDKDLNGKAGSFDVSNYNGQNPLDFYGDPRLSFDRHYLVQIDGTPRFFLSDTAWNGALLSTDDEWKRYLADRAAKKFTAARMFQDGRRLAAASSPPDANGTWSAFTLAACEPRGPITKMKAGWISSFVKAAMVMMRKSGDG
jgi:hypothetical protein